MVALLHGICAVSLLAKGAAAWGNLGHETVGYVAMEFLAPKALSFVKSSLGSTYNESLGPAATWADSVKYTSAYEWSKPLHFADAEDDPMGGSCSVEESRDCGDQDCILAAISNYTARIQETSLSASQTQEALKFIDHFLGDVGQPLHIEAYEYGGNDIDAVCAGDKTNLHAAWDTGMVETNIDNNHGGSVTTYVSDLVNRIQTGPYSNLTSSWLSCTSITETASSSSKRDLSLRGEIMGVIADYRSNKRPDSVTIKELECPLVWAKEANAYDCSVVFTYTSGEDLCTGDYINSAIPVIDLQLAKQGYRLAAWLNVIFDGATNLP